MRNLKLNGTQLVNGKEVNKVTGGFGEDCKCILAKDIAFQHENRLDKVNDLIKNNISRFNEKELIDFLKPSEGLRDFAKENGLITNNRIQNIFLLSERGYIKLVSMMDNTNDKKFEVMDKLIEEYFTMKEIINSDENLKDKLLLSLFSKDPLDVANAHKQLVELETKPLLESIENKDTIINKVINDNGIYAVRTVGKVLQPYSKVMGANKIFTYMRNKNILMDCEKTQNHNLPYAKYSSYFDIKYTNVDINGYTKTVSKVYFNGKGLKYFLNRLVKDGILNNKNKEVVAKSIKSE